MDEDSVQIYDAIVKKGGSLGFTDKADPEIIKKHFNMSKNAFKRAVGRLLKEGQTTYFNSVGMGLFDVCIAQKLYEVAKEK